MASGRKTTGYRVRVCEGQSVISDLVFLIGTIPNTRERADIEYRRKSEQYTKPGDVVELYEIEEVKTEQYNLIRQVVQPIPQEGTQ